MEISDKEEIIMQIVFWSCRAGQSAVSSSLLAIGSVMAIEHKMKVAALQTQFSCNNLQYPFFKVSDKANVEQYTSAGMDSLLRTVKGGSANKDIIANCAISFMSGFFNLYTQTTNGDQKMYLNNLVGCLPSLFSSLGTVFDVSLIDTTAGNDSVSLRVLQQADIIVVCFPQAEWLINYFFEKYQFDTTKVFYLFGDYDTAAACSVKNMIKSHRGMMKLENTACIPHSVNFCNAMNNSTLVSYMLRSMDCNENSDDYEFISRTKDAVSKLLHFAGVKE